VVLGLDFFTPVGCPSYAHTGMLQLGRRFTGHQLKPAYSEAEIYEVTTTITTAILTLASKFFAVHNLPDASKEAERLIESYGPASKQKAGAERLSGEEVVL
jgi:hypothetical protein